MMRTDSLVKKHPRTVRYQAKFPGYQGYTLWDVSHPDYKQPVRVLAPVENEGACAIVAAAMYWGRRWQEITFYCDCKLNKVKPAKAGRKDKNDTGRTSERGRA